MRGEAAVGAADWLYLAYDIYKKAHLMASPPREGFDRFGTGAIGELKEGGNVKFGKAFKSRDAN